MCKPTQQKNNTTADTSTTGGDDQEEAQDAQDVLDQSASVEVISPVTPVSLSACNETATANLPLSYSRFPIPTSSLDAIPTSSILPYDILCGRGAGTNRHIGNQFFRGLVSKAQPAYAVASVIQKGEIAKQVVDTIRLLDPPGRFLKRMSKGTSKSGGGVSLSRSDDDGLWIDIGDRAAREKTAQALREKAPELKRALLTSKSSPQSFLGHTIPISPITVASDYSEEQDSKIVANILQPSLHQTPSSKILARPEGFTSISERDVIFGRGGLSNSHPGNIRYRELVRARKQEYLLTSKKDKASISSQIVADIKNQGGRFLSRVRGEADGSYYWEEVDDDRARDKTSQALRERSTEMRTAILPNSEKNTLVRSDPRESTRQGDSKVTYDKDSQDISHKQAASTARATFNIRNEHHLIPGLSDVLFGRGAGINHHPGNLYFRSLVKENHEAYTELSRRTDKSRLAETIVALIKGQVPPGRFLEKKFEGTADEQWVEVDDKRARDKACQSLREKRFGLKKDISQSRLPLKKRRKM